MALKEAPSLFDEILDFLAESPSAQDILDYHPPNRLQARLSDLLARNGEGQLGADESAELEEFLRINRLMSRLKARVRLKRKNHL